MFCIEPSWLGVIETCLRRIQAYQEVDYVNQLHSMHLFAY